ncbi:putative phosphoadenosine phosphosulfate reductase [Escherichia coli]|nr:putative phosphoadenosine phosphosulfate reductase [Escherichia coli]
MRGVPKFIEEENVLSTAIQRIEWVFSAFSSVCFSFSGGKNSSVLFHLTADITRKKKVVSQYCSLTGSLSISAPFNMY